MGIKTKSSKISLLNTEDRIYSKQEFFITTNKEVILDELDIVWNKNSLLKIITNNPEKVKEYLDKNYRNKYCNIYKNIPLMKLLYPGGVVRTIEL